MSSDEEIIRRASERNRRVFKASDRKNAGLALEIYVAEIDGGLRKEFNHFPRDVVRLQLCPVRHRRMLGDMKASLGRLERFIEILEGLKGRDAMEINPLWYSTANVPETIMRTLHPGAIPSYRAFHAAVAAYLGELSKGTGDDAAIELARNAAYLVNPGAWRAAGVRSLPEHGVTDLGTQLYLEAIVLDVQ